MSGMRMKFNVTREVKFNVARFIGILALGASLFFLADITSYYPFIEPFPARAYAICLVIAAIFLSLEMER
jgi:hypothetical protein